jgi:hypothetical protein
MKTVRYYVTEAGEFRRVLPSGSVSYSDSMLEMIRDAYEYDKAGYEVLLDDEPLVPRTGFFGWLNRLVDRLPRRKKP